VKSKVFSLVIVLTLMAFWIGCNWINAKSPTSMPSHPTIAPITVTFEPLDINEPNVLNYQDAWLAYISNDGDVKLVDFNGTKHKQLTTDGGNSYPSWSRDSSRLAYIHEGSEIWVYDMSTQTKTRVHRAERPLDSNCLFRYIQWSPNGDGVFYHANCGGPTMNYINFVELGANESPYSGFEVWAYPSHAISPQGDLLAYCVFSNADPWGWGIAIHNFNISSKYAPLSVQDEYKIEGPSDYEILPLQDAYKISGISWKPNSEMLTFYAESLGGSSETRIMTIFLDGHRIDVEKDISVILRSRITLPTLSWSSDGQALAYENDDYIWIYSEGNAEKIIEGFNPSWQPSSLP